MQIKTFFRKLFIILLISHPVFAAPDLSMKELLRLGKEAYTKNCAACHQADGSGIPLDAPPLRENAEASSYLVVDKPVSKHIEIVLNGISGTTMQAFWGKLSPLELASIITYERNAWGNNTGDRVTPADILKAHNQPKAIFTDYDKQFTLQKLMQDGATNYRAYCARCHLLNGKGKAPHGPKLADSFVARDPELISHKIELVLEGAPGTRMRGYAQQLNDYEIASILTYIANAWDNNGKQIIQPIEIKKEREKLARQKQQPIDNSVKLTMRELMTHGAIEYKAFCARCHLLDGAGYGQPSVPPLKGSKIATGKPITAHIDIVLTGVAGSIMRAFAPRLTNVELAEIITYERNAWGNNTGDIVQPAQIQAERVRLHDKIEYQKQHQLQQQYIKDQEALKASGGS